jgi:hypothetical protein
MVDAEKNIAGGDQEKKPDAAALRKQEESERQKKMESDFLFSAQTGNLGNLRKNYRHFGEHINVCQSDTRATALHLAAASKARKSLLWLGEQETIDYLVQDCKGRLPSAVAYEVADDPVIGRYLTKKENEQARARGIDIRTLLVS